MIGLVDNLLRPSLVGKDTKLPDYVVLVSTVGGLSLFGINGFVIGPLIAALFFAGWTVFRDDWAERKRRAARLTVRRPVCIPRAGRSTGRRRERARSAWRSSRNSRNGCSSPRRSSTRALDALLDDGAGVRPRPPVATPADRRCGAATAPEADPPLGAGPSQRRAGLIGRLFGGAEKGRVLDDDMLESLEELLIAADMGVDTSLKLAARMAEGRFGRRLGAREIKELLAAEITAVLEPVARPMPIYPKRPQVVLVVGVNGSGKTTTIGKLASQFKRGRASRW